MGGDDWTKDAKGNWVRKEEKGVADAAKSGSSEQEIVSVAIRQLPGDIRERLEKLFEEGLLKEGDLDLRSITVFASLNEGLQARVMNHMESERIYVANARSKSGFLIATCDKAKTGCLDARGLGAIDPWRTALVAMATAKPRQFDLKSERDWLDENEDKDAIKLNIDVTCAESELGVPNVTIELPITETSAAIRAKLVAMGIRSMPANRMKFHADPVGFLKDRYSFAFFNLADGTKLTLSERKRAGKRYVKDHTVMPKRPKTQPAPGENPVEAVKNLAAGKSADGAAAAKFPGLPGLPGLPGMTMPAGLPGLPKLPALPGLGGSLPAGLPGLAGLPPLPGKAGGLPGMTMPSLPGMPTIPGMPPLPLPGMTAPGGADPMLAMKAMLDKMKAGGLPPAPDALGSMSKAAPP